MSDSEIHVDAARLEGLAENIVMFANSIHTEMARLQGGLQRLSNTWQDEEFRKFKRKASELAAKLEVLVREVRKHEPDLRADAAAVRAYLNKTL